MSEETASDMRSEVVDENASVPVAEITATEAKKLEQEALSQLRMRVQIALESAVAAFPGKRNTPMTHFMMAAKAMENIRRLFPHVKADQHFSVVVGDKAIHIQPKTEAAKRLLGVA